MKPSRPRLSLPLKAIPILIVTGAVMLVTAAGVAGAASTSQPGELLYGVRRPALMLQMALTGDPIRYSKLQSQLDDSVAPADDSPAGRMAGAAEWLAANTPQGSLVFQTDWDDFPTLFFYNTHNAYTVGLDPTYLELADPARYALWVDLTQGRGLDLSQAILSRFGARYAVSDLKHKAFLARAAADPQMQEVYRDSNSVVFAIVGRDG